MTTGPAIRRGTAIRGIAFAALMLAATAALTLRNLGAFLPAGEWWPALLGASDGDVKAAVAHYAFYPRLAVSLLCGAGLGLSGALLQEVLGNPLAEPGTLGIFAGAKLALAVATLWVPGILVLGYEPIATVGGAVAFAVVLALSRPSGFAPVFVILAGLIVSLTIDAASRILLIWHFEALSDLFAWQTGSLSQSGWSVAWSMALRVSLAIAAAGLLARPLAALGLGDAAARGLGLPVAGVRALALLVAVGIGASIAGQIGTVAFVGFAGPAIARNAGARRVVDRLLWGSLASAVILTLADQLGQWLGAGTRGLPTGAITAFLGAPLLVWLVARARPAARPERAGPAAAEPYPLARPWAAMLAGLALLALAILVALALGRTAQSWFWADGDALDRLLPLRAPRVAAALAAGAMLAVAGCLIQRLTGNVMASPEFLGVSAGAGLVLIVAILVAPGLDRVGLMAATAAGALATLVAVLRLGRRSGYDPARMLLIGIALAAFLGAFLTALLVSGDPRAGAVLTWMSGSTYPVTARDATIACATALAVFAILPLAGRWLAILPLGDGSSRSLGLVPEGGRLALLTAAAILTAASTLIVGPLTFVGLIGPHLVRAAGFRRPVEQLAAAAVAGALIMVAADWLGRTLTFPWQIPAGLVATCLGGLYVTWLLARR